MGPCSRDCAGCNKSYDLLSSTLCRWVLCQVLCILLTLSSTVNDCAPLAALPHLGDALDMCLSYHPNYGWLPKCVFPCRDCRCIVQGLTQYCFSLCLHDVL